MRCPECGHENADEMKFCGERGNRLTVLCRECEVASFGPVPVKGLPEPVEVFELVGARPARTRREKGLTDADAEKITTW